MSGLATLKAGIDAVSRGVNPENTRLEFANNTPVIDLINALKQGKRFDTPDLQQMSRVKGFAWNTYSFVPSCRGDLLVTRALTHGFALQKCRYQVAVEADQAFNDRTH